MTMKLVQKNNKYLLLFLFVLYSWTAIFSYYFLIIYSDVMKL